MRVEQHLDASGQQIVGIWVEESRDPALIGASVEAEIAAALDNGGNAVREEFAKHFGTGSSIPKSEGDTDA